MSQPRAASNENAKPEPWLRGTLSDVDPLQRQVLHALQLTAEDVDRWCASMTVAQLSLRPAGVASVAFHLRHIVRSLDRLLTYADGGSLSDEQLAALSKEADAVTSSKELLNEFHHGLQAATSRIRNFAPAAFSEPRTVGRVHLPTTLAGLLIHCAEHTQRHTGQAIVTARIATSTLCDGASVSSLSRAG